MPLETFRVYPDRRQTGKRGYYFTVNIFKTLKELRGKVRQLDPTCNTMHCYGACQWYRTLRDAGDGKVSFSKGIGEIQLCTKHMGVGIVSHESLHAALRWADCKGIKVETCRSDIEEFCSDNEESLCYAHGDIVSQIYTELFARKVVR